MFSDRALRLAAAAGLTHFTLRFSFHGSIAARLLEVGAVGIVLLILVLEGLHLLPLIFESCSKAASSLAFEVLTVRLVWQRLSQELHNCSKASGPLCPCGRGKLFVNCHGK
jgi:hypothetical protein